MRPDHDIAHEYWSIHVGRHISKALDLLERLDPEARHASTDSVMRIAEDLQTTVEFIRQNAGDWVRLLAEIEQ